MQFKSGVPDVIAFLVLPSLAFSDPKSTTQGWVFGIDVGSAAISFEHQPRDGGAIVGLRFGYGINRIVTLYVGIYEADAVAPDFVGFDDVTFGHADFGVRLHWADDGRRWVPYGNLALTLWPISDVLRNGEQTTTDFSGLPTFSIGGGLAVYLSESWALDVDFKWGASVFKDVPVGNVAMSERERHVHTFADIHASSARLTFGVSWWP